MTREIILDTETTGLRASMGHRLLSVAAVEVVDGKPTGRVFSAIVNPQRPIPPETTAIHGLTDEMVAGKPLFAEIAQGLKDFIGDSRIVITCRTADDGYVLDIGFLTQEMRLAGFAPFPEDQWLNVRRWGEAMFGAGNASLDAMLDRYKIDRSEREENGHGALLDAALLAKVYPKLKADYEKFSKPKTPKPESSKAAKPPAP